MIFGGASTLYALDGVTGAEVASICLDPRAAPAPRCQGSEPTIELLSSPALFKVGDEARVVVGMDVHNASGVGRTGMVSFRLRPPGGGGGWRIEPLWKFDPEARAAYVGPDLLTRGSGTGNGCAGVWSSPAIDVRNDLVFFGTSSCPHDGVDTGESLWGVRLSTGALAWVFHPHAPPWPSQRWDDDFGASPNLLPYGLVGNGSKDGWYYALDRKTGVLKWASHAGESGHLTGDFAIGGMIGSAAVGKVRGEPAVFATTAISTPIYAPLDEKPGDIDASLAEDPGRMFSVHAIRVRDGKVLWRSPLARQSYGAASYANGVVFMPSTFTATINGFDADTGAPLFAMPIIGPSSSTPVAIRDAIYVGGGTRTTDLEYKAFGAGALDGAAGPSPLSIPSGVWSYRILLD